MLSPRLQAIATLVPKDSTLVDVGTDHAYLPIYLVENSLVKKAYATDISPQVIKFTKENIANHHLSNQIKVYVADGLKDLDFTYDTVVLAGMGFFTIQRILKESLTLPSTLIIECQSKLAELRLFMHNLGYKIAEEVVIWDKFYYAIIKYQKGKETLTEAQILFGKSNNILYFEDLKKKYLKIYTQSKQAKYQKYLLLLDEIIEKKSVAK